MKYFKVDFRSLSAQMILSFTALVLLTAIAVGFPAIWLIRGQLQRQAWAQVEQGSRAAQALYAAQQNEMTNLATLTAQRPTLRDLLVRGEQTPLLVYLRTLQEGTGLDLMLICTSDHQAIAQVGPANAESFCAITRPDGFQIMPTETTAQVWLFAAHDISNGGADMPEKVIVGVLLDDEFAVQMRTQTGLEHTLLLAGQPVATSLNDITAPRQMSPSNERNSAKQGTLALDGGPYYTLNFPLTASTPEENLEQDGLAAEVALVVADIAATQQGLVWTMIGSIILVAIVGSVLGTFLARRIGRPLTHLAAAATALSQSDLDSSITVKARVREVALVSQALENARIDLQYTLTELRQEKAWTDHLLEAIVEGIITLDNFGRITFFSPGAERITGWSRDEVLNRTCDEVFQLTETDQPFSQCIPPPNRRNKVGVELAKGRHATLAITGSQFLPPEAGDTSVAVVFRDVSEEEMAHRLIGHFLANISHEFRTPLSAVAASIELLLDQAPDLTATELQELLTSLHLGILGLQTLVDNLLESASIEAGRFQVYARPSNLSKIIAEAIRIMQPLLDKHGQRLALELSMVLPVIRVRADPRRTVQVLVNLLSNASKYGPDEAEITLSATVVDSVVRVTVADRGPGVLPGNRNDLFRRFVHRDLAGDKSQYGAGLGLSVVKAVIEAQGGQVGVEDRLGGGLVFWFTLLEEKGL